MLDVIERQHGVAHHEAGIVFVGIRRLVRHRLEPSRRVVSQVAHRTTRESRETGHGRRTELGHDPAEGLDERRVAFGPLPTALDDRLAVARPQHEERILPKERIARHLLAALDRFEQERVVRMLGDLEEG